MKKIYNLIKYNISRMIKSISSIECLHDASNSVRKKRLDNLKYIERCFVSRATITQYLMESFSLGDINQVNYYIRRDINYDYRNDDFFASLDESEIYRIFLGRVLHLFDLKCENYNGEYKTYEKELRKAWVQNNEVNKFFP